MPIQCTCQNCGKTFNAKPYRVKAGQSRYCSLPCAHAPRGGIWQEDGTVHVPLTRGKYAIIDAEDAERVLAFNWCAVRPKGSQSWYAAKNTRGETIQLHRFILGVECPDLVDHIDRNGLNNRRSNLRAATAQQSVVNRDVRGASGYRGVSLHKVSGRWHAAIVHNRKSISLRYHDTPEEAARAYDRACLDLYGEFCVLNFPGEHQPPPPG